MNRTYTDISHFRAPYKNWSYLGMGSDDMADAGSVLSPTFQIPSDTEEPIQPPSVLATPPVGVPRALNTTPAAPPAAGGSTLSTLNTILSYGGMVAGAYHGYKRNNGSIGWAIGWAILGGMWPIAIPIMLVQGFAKPASRTATSNKSRRRRRKAKSNSRRGLNAYNAKRSRDMAMALNLASEMADMKRRGDYNYARFSQIEDDLYGLVGKRDRRTGKLTLPRAVVQAMQPRSAKSNKRRARRRSR